LLQTKEKTDSTGRSPDGRSPFFAFFRALIALNLRLVPLTVRPGRGSQAEEAARRNNRRASNCHRERAAQPGAERSKIRFRTG
jgi:hypothetical protein